ncbi:hypothetical protein Tco_0643325 [Tanacetum coccineum]
MSKKDLLRLDEELAFKLQAEEEEERLAREKAQQIEKLEQESSKKQKVEEDKEFEELKQCLEIVPDDGDDVTIDATPLSIKYPTIVDYKIYQEGKKSYFQIIRADVKARFKKTEPVNYMDNLLLHHLKIMFEHHVEDNVWKNQQGLVKVLNWKLYDSCGVHCVTVQSVPFYLLVEKIYPLTNHTLHQMFNNVKLQVDYECKMAFELLRLVKNSLRKIMYLNEVFRSILMRKDKDRRNDKDCLEIKITYVIVTVPSSSPSSYSEESSYFLIISINITSPSLSFVQTNFESDDQGTKFIDSRNELRLQTFSMMNEIDGSGVTKVVLLRRHFKTQSLDELRLSDFNLFSDQEYSEEEEEETMAETIEQYMSKTRADYGSGVARPKIKDKDNFELKGQFLKELRTNTFSGSDHEDANEHIEKVLKIVDLFHIPNITIDHVMLRAFPMSLTEAASHLLRNEPTGSITTWDGLKKFFMNKYCPPARTAKKMEEINNFQQEPDENL